VWFIFSLILEDEHCFVNKNEAVPGNRNRRISRSPN